jgi:uncharacterized protein YdeI (YjbR/CyaY-like superfamily)
VNIVPDTQPRTLEVPGDLATALDTESEARQAFEKLSSCTGKHR